MRAVEILESWNGTGETVPGNYTALLWAVESDAEAMVAKSIEIARSDENEPAHIVEQSCAGRRQVLEKLK